MAETLRKRKKKKLPTPRENLPAQTQTSPLVPLRQPKQNGLVSLASLAKGNPTTSPTFGMATNPIERKPKPSTPAWADKKILGMRGDRFVNLAGGLAQAIAPDTAQGRVGGVMAKLGAEEMGRKREAETLAEERGYKKKTLGELRGYEKEVLGEQRAFEAPERELRMEGIRARTEKARRPARQAGFSRDKSGGYQSGYWEDDKFTPRRGAFPAEIKQLEGAETPGVKQFFVGEGGVITGLDKSGKVVSTSEAGVGKTRQPKGKLTPMGAKKEYVRAAGLLDKAQSGVTEYSPEEIEAMPPEVKKAYLESDSSGYVQALKNYMSDLDTEYGINPKEEVDPMQSTYNELRKTLSPEDALYAIQNKELPSKNME